MANPRAAVLGFAAGVTAALLLGLCAWRHGRIKLMSDKKDDRVLLGKLICRCIERGGATEEGCGRSGDHGFRPKPRGAATPTKPHIGMRTTEATPRRSRG